jgi:wyosine [tRNA(Phe)-imidazoG37] synthetase (radical SAM superfamily)
VKYVYGPIPSRRLGRSLGVDPVPLKACNWNCVYCQLGRTVPLRNVRHEYVPKEDVISEVSLSLAAHGEDEVDWITFVGSGEPTLHERLGWMIREVKAITQIPVAVITNGSTLYRPEVATYERLLYGLEAFRSAYAGKLWVEVMLVRGLNDTESSLRDLAQALNRIKPDEIHIMLPTRPPAETWVLPSDEEGLMRAIALLGGTARLVHPAEGAFDLSGCASLVDAIVGVITRHPMSQAQLAEALEGWAPEQAKQALAELESGGRARRVERLGTQFWSASPSRFPDEAASLAADSSRGMIPAVDV